MPSRLRGILVVVAFILAAIGAAVYVAHRNAVASGDQLASGADKIASIDLNALLQNPAERDQRMLDTTFRRVEDAYYKPVQAQLLVDGEDHTLVDFLRSRGIKEPQLPRLTATGDRTHDVGILEDTLRRAQKTYPKNATNTEYMEVAIRGIMNSLGDPYTTYLTKSEIDGLQESLQGGQFGGIGVYIVQDPRTQEIVVDPIEGNPAIKAGVKPGDVVETVDNKPVRGLKLDAVEHLIRGRIGTSVSLTVHSHEGPSTHSVKVTRAFIHVPSVKAKMEDGIEYVRLFDFGTSSYDEVRAAMLEGKEKHARGYILDLRNNGGGLLDAAVQVSEPLRPERHDRRDDRPRRRARREDGAP